MIKATIRTQTLWPAEPGGLGPFANQGNLALFEPALCRGYTAGRPQCGAIVVAFSFGASAYT